MRPENIFVLFIYSRAQNELLSNNFRRNFSASAVNQPLSICTDFRRLASTEFPRRAERTGIFFVSLNGAENQASDIVGEELKLLEISLTPEKGRKRKRGKGERGLQGGTPVSGSICNALSFTGDDYDHGDEDDKDEKQFQTCPRRRRALTNNVPSRR